MEKQIDHSGWRKSSYSGNGGADCVEVATGPGAVGVRDSKDPHGPVLVISQGAWTRFLARI